MLAFVSKESSGDDETEASGATQKRRPNRLAKNRPVAAAAAAAVARVLKALYVCVCI